MSMKLMPTDHGMPSDRETTAAFSPGRRRFVQALALSPFLSVSLPANARGAAGNTLHADGAWRLAIDPDDVGIARAWFRAPLAQPIELPSNLSERRIGDAIAVDTQWTGDINDRSFFTAPAYARYRRPGQVKVPFCLQPDTFYKGAAWYQRAVRIPEDWRGKRIVVHLERPHWETRVWVGDRYIGRDDALNVPHEYDLGILEPGEHTLSIRVDNRLIVDIGVNGHGVTDHTQGSWNGIAGRIELRATEPVWIDDLQVYPQLARARLRIAGRIGNISGRAGRGTLEFSYADVSHRIEAAWNADGTDFDTVVEIDPANAAALRTWDEFSPHVYSLSARLNDADEKRVNFGWREFAAQGTEFVLNGRKTFFRGTLECCIFPLTGHPPTELEPWRRIMRVVRSFGLNHLRFHSYCPPEAAFDAADEMGVYCQVETCWANQSTRLGSGEPVDRWVYAETDRILKAHGNHPSFLLMPYGNEPGGGENEAGERRRDAYLSEYVCHYRDKDPRRLWSSGSGWPELAENQFHVAYEPRIQLWGAELKSRINALAPETQTDYRAFVGARSVPVISHEIGEWCAYPDFSETAKYTGYLQPKNFEIFRDRLEHSGLGGLARDFLMASGKLQTLCYKEDIESALRTPGMGGFQLLDLHDFPGQGTALVGVLNAFWDEKGYATAAEYSRFCNRTVPLARMATRIAEPGKPFEFAIDVAHYGAAALHDAVVSWHIVDRDGRVLAHGEFAPMRIELGNRPLSLRASADLAQVDAAVAAKLVVRIGASSGTVIAENDWDVWTYPKLPPTPLPARVRTASSIDEDALAHVRAGGKLLLTLPGRLVRNHDEQPVKLGFSSVFWNTLWTKRQAPTTLGLLCDPRHPALAQFPSEFHSNWQWWYLLHRAGALRLDLLPHELRPIVRIIDDWFTARPLALIVETALGKGKVLVCGFDLDPAAAADPVSAQMRRSLLAYMHDDDAFSPATTITEEALRSLVVPD